MTFLANTDALIIALRQNGGNPGNAEQDMNFYNQSGGLKLHSVKRSSDTEIEALVQIKKTERWVSFSMTVEAQAPHGISDIRVQPGVEPSK
jgi:hypothetical protein